ncbi:MAG: LysR family transcriptional regulator [Blautia sp.]|nr:LysR family transcriptional regulator [Blautia sp.]MDY3999484.1 LysR family transcriptional regulator [Blautia sp.]
MFQGMEYVYAVYKEKSFSKAAQKLFISQPSLSAAVKRVEQKVGYPIFDRSTKPLSLTECGEKYISAVEKIMAVENGFVDFINDWGELKTGSLVLGGSSLFSSWILPQIMGAFSRKYPLVKIALVEENTSRLEELLQSGGVDLVMDNCILDSSVFDRCEYQEEHLLLAVPGNFKINEKLQEYGISAEDIRKGIFLNPEVPGVPLEYFEKEPFILLKPDNDTGKRAMNLCQDHGFTPNVVFELDQQQTAYNVTCSGLGISFVSDTLVSLGTDNPNVIYYKLEGKDNTRKLFFYWKKGRYFSRVMEEFLKTAGAGCQQTDSI